MGRYQCARNVYKLQKQPVIFASSGDAENFTKRNKEIYHEKRYLGNRNCGEKNVET